MAGLMFVTAGILTVPAAGTAAAEEINSDGIIICPLIYPAPEGCGGDYTSSIGNIDLATLLGSLSASM